MPNEDKEGHEKEVALLEALYRRLLRSMKAREGEWEALEAMMMERARWIVREAVKGFGMDYGKAIELLTSAAPLTAEEKEKKMMLQAAVDNLVDFAVAEEYQMAEDVLEAIEDFEVNPDEIDFEDPDYFEDLLKIFLMYNDRYARVENLDVQYAMIVAAFWAAIQNQATLMYMTQGDERVRPWHRQYEGFTAPKEMFPEWLIPPIEHQCRCYLVEDTASSIGGVMAQSMPEIPEWFNGTFKESVAKGGRIFSDEHPYFQIDERAIGRLREIAERIKKEIIDV